MNTMSFSGLTVQTGGKTWRNAGSGDPATGDFGRAHTLASRLLPDDSAPHSAFATERVMFDRPRRWDAGARPEGEGVPLR